MNVRVWKFIFIKYIWKRIIYIGITFYYLRYLPEEKPQHISEKENITGGEKEHVDGCDNEESDLRVLGDEQYEDELVSQSHSFIAKYSYILWTC